MKETLSFLKDNHEAIIALLALVVSCVAIFQSNSGMRMQREHNFLSVRPIASVLRLNFENRIGVILENRGLGPMVIEEISVWRGAEHLGSNLVDQMSPLKESRPWSNFWRGLQGTVLQPEKEIELLLLTGELSDATYVDNRDSVRFELSKLTVKLKYSDIYGNEFHATESLSSFGQK